MPRITVLPNASSCPEGKSFDAKAGTFLCDALLKNGIEIEHRLREILRLFHLPRHHPRGIRLAHAREEGEEDQTRQRPGVLTTRSRLVLARWFCAHDDLLVEIPPLHHQPGPGRSLTIWLFIKKI